MLNMRSIDDRSTAARIRDAAITEFAARGVAATSIRAVAAAAGVSPALVMHHYGSKDNLRVVCDEHVAALIRTRKTDALTGRAAFDPLAALRAAADDPPIARYLARTLVDGSPHVVELVDELVEDALGYIQMGVDAGLIEPTDFPRERAAILTLWSLGGIVLHEHLERLLGVDITDSMDEPHVLSGYMLPALDILGGFFTEHTVQHMKDALLGVSPVLEETGT